MIFKVYTPTTPSQRHIVRINKEHLRKKPLIKACVVGFKNSAGRSNTGKVTVRHKGGGHKKNYRKIEFSRFDEREGVICSIEYDPNRKAFVASVYSSRDKNFFYILAPTDLVVGDVIKSGTKVGPKLGFSLPLHAIPEGCLVHSISATAGKAAQLSRAAGTYAVIVEKTAAYVSLRLSSGILKKIHKDCYCTVGAVSNRAVFLTRLGKAGNSRWLNVRPSVRGVAMNPVDHPHGGGEGKKSGSLRTPWGKLNKKVARKNRKNKWQ